MDNLTLEPARQLAFDKFLTISALMNDLTYGKSRIAALDRIHLLANYVKTMSGWEAHVSQDWGSTDQLETLRSRYFRIGLCAAPNAVRVMGELDSDMWVRHAWLEYTDFELPKWFRLYTGEDDVIKKFANCFFKGERK